MKTPVVTLIWGMENYFAAWRLFTQALSRTDGRVCRVVQATCQQTNEVCGLMSCVPRRMCSATCCREMPRFSRHFPKWSKHKQMCEPSPKNAEWTTRCNSTITTPAHQPFDKISRFPRTETGCLRGRNLGFALQSVLSAFPRQAGS